MAGTGSFWSELLKVFDDQDDAPIAVKGKNGALFVQSTQPVSLTSAQITTQASTFNATSDPYLYVGYPVVNSQTGIGYTWAGTAFTQDLSVTTSAEHAVLGWRTTTITATETSAIVLAGNVYGGIRCQTAGSGTTVTVYDYTSVSAGNILTNVTAGSLAVNDFISPFSNVVIQAGLVAPSAGVVLATGLHIVVGGTGAVLRVYYR